MRQYSGWQRCHQTILGLVGLAFLGATPGFVQATPINCGDTLGPGGTLTLETDLTCTSPNPDEDPTTALTLVGPVTLNLKGHTLNTMRRRATTSLT